MILGRSHITLSSIRDIVSVTRYYKLQSSIDPEPDTPTDSTISSWSTTEPTYTEGSTNRLYTVEKTTFSFGSPEYSAVSLSSSYEAAKAAYNRAVNALTAANGKNKIFHQTTAPTSSVGLQSGDTWFDTNDNYTMYTWNGSSWIAEQFGTNAIANSAITTFKINANAITSSKIAAGEIKTSNIDAGAITTDKIYTNAITAEKIDAGAITTDKIAANSVTAAKIDVNDLFAQDITATGTITTPILKTADYNGTTGFDYVTDPTDGSVALVSTLHIDNTLGSIINLRNGTINLGGGRFIVDGLGATVGGLTIGSNKIYGGDSTTGVVAMQKPTSSTSFVFAAGGSSHNNYSDCPFRVTKGGKLYASSGEVGGFELTPSSIRHMFFLSTTGIPAYRFFLKTGTAATENVFALQNCPSSSQEASENPDDWTWNYLFRINYNGDLYANSVHSLGNIYDSNNNIIFQRFKSGSNPEYPVYWNNSGILRIATKTTNKGSSETGTAFILANGLYAAGSVDSTPSVTSAHVYLAGGCDTTSRWIGSPAINGRTYNAAANVYVTTNGYLGKSTSSSLRYKHDIEYLTNEDRSVVGKKDRVVKKSKTQMSLDDVLDIPVVTFKYNEGYVTGEADFDYDKPIAGFIAEDVAKVCPECATYIEDEDGNMVPEAWDAKQLVVRMLYVLQRQQEEIKQLKESLNE